MKEQEVLADMLDKNRELTRFYLSWLKDVDSLSQIEVNGEKLNSVYWIVAHLIWAEDNLINVCTGHESVVPEFINQYKLGDSNSIKAGSPDFKSLLQLMKEVHEKCKLTILAMTDEELAADNPKSFQFGTDKSNRMMIKHAIRHEGIHAGNLAWLAKLNGIKTI